MTESAAERVPLPERMELADAIQHYLLTASALGYSPSTLRAYEAALKRILEFARRHGRIWLDELTPTLLRAAVADAKGPTQDGEARRLPSNWKGGEGLAAQLVAAARSLSTRLLSDGIPMNDLRVVKCPKMPERIQPRLTREEFLALEEAIRQQAFRARSQQLLVARDLSMLYLLADTGIRAAEFCGLDIEDVNFEQGTVRVRHGKGGKDRTLSIADSDPHELDGGLTLRAIRTYLFHREERGLMDHRALWLSRTGNRLIPSHLRRTLSVLCDAAGIDGNRPPHAFRRGWFTEAYRQEPMALPVLVARMGWSAKSQAMVTTYTRGANLELARTEERPSLAKQWRASRPPAKAAASRFALPALAAPAAPVARVKCPFCAEEILAEARKCRFCGEWLAEQGRGVA